MSFGPELFKVFDRIAGPARQQPYKEPASTRVGFQRRLRYIISARTGIPAGQAREILDVPKRTWRRWINERAMGSKAAQQKVDDLYQRFLGINNRAYAEGKAKKLARAVKGDALRLENLQTQRRTYKPKPVRWTGLIQAWAAGDPGAADIEWEDILDSWDDSDKTPWLPTNIAAVDIV